MKQSQLFYQSEGDAYFERNRDNLKPVHPVSEALHKMLSAETDFTVPWKILEIGCGSGRHWEQLLQEMSVEVYGLDPSAQSVQTALQYGVQAQRGTAEDLPFQTQFFDVLIFGFCLYVCDQEDLFRIAAEADRVLKSQGWLIIHDFYSPHSVHKSYHHYPGVYTHKMDYRSLFEWHPAYTCFSHELLHHSQRASTDNPDEWVALSVLRKNQTGGIIC